MNVIDIKTAYSGQTIKYNMNMTTTKIVALTMSLNLREITKTNEIRHSLKS